MLSKFKPTYKIWLLTMMCTTFMNSKAFSFDIDYVTLAAGHLVGVVPSIYLFDTFGAPSVTGYAFFTLPPIGLSTAALMTDLDGSIGRSFGGNALGIILAAPISTLISMTLEKNGVIEERELRKYIAIFFTSIWTTFSVLFYPSNGVIANLFSFNVNINNMKVTPPHLSLYFTRYTKKVGLKLNLINGDF